MADFEILPCTSNAFQSGPAKKANNDAEKYLLKYFHPYTFLLLDMMVKRALFCVLKSQRSEEELNDCSVYVQ